VESKRGFAPKHLVALSATPKFTREKDKMALPNNREDWIDLPVQDLDSFIDMTEMERASMRENLKVIQLKVNKLAITPHGTKHCVSQKRSWNFPSPSPKSTKMFTLG